MSSDATTPSAIQSLGSTDHEKLAVQLDVAAEPKLGSSATPPQAPAADDLAVPLSVRRSDGLHDVAPSSVMIGGLPATIRTDW